MNEYVPPSNLKALRTELHRMKSPEDRRRIEKAEEKRKRKAEKLQRTWTGAR